MRIKYLFVLILLCWAVFAQNAEEEVIVEPKIIEKAAMQMVGLAFKGEPTPDKIMPLWVELLARAGEIKNAVNPDEAWGAYIMLDEEENSMNMICFAGFEVSKPTDLPEGMEVLEVPAGKYAVFTHIGLLDNLKETYGYIYGVWAQTNDKYFLNNAPQLEFYGPNFEGGSTESQLDLLIPIIDKPAQQQ